MTVLWTSPSTPATATLGSAPNPDPNPNLNPKPNPNPKPDPDPNPNPDPNANPNPNPHQVFVIPHNFLAPIVPQMQGAFAPGAVGISLIKGIEFKDSKPILISDLLAVRARRCPTP